MMKKMFIGLVACLMLMVTIQSALASDFVKIDSDQPSGISNVRGYDIWGDGTYLLFADGAGGINSYNVSNGNFTHNELNRFGRPSNEAVTAVWGDGTYYYAGFDTVGTGAMDSFSIDSGGYMTKISTTDGGAPDAYDIWGDGTYIFSSTLNTIVSSQVNSSGHLITLHESVPGSSGLLDTSGVWHDGTYAYANAKFVNSYSVNGSGGLVFISNSSEEEDILSINQGVFGDGTYMYGCGEGVLNSYSVDGGGVVTLTDSETIVNGSSSNCGVWADGSFVYVANGISVLSVYSVDGAGQLTYVDSVNDNGEGDGVAVWGGSGYVYVGTSDGYIQSYNFTGSAPPEPPTANITWEERWIDTFSYTDSICNGYDYESYLSNEIWDANCSLAQANGSHFYCENQKPTAPNVQFNLSNLPLAANQDYVRFNFTHNHKDNFSDIALFIYDFGGDSIVQLDFVGSSGNIRAYHNETFTNIGTFTQNTNQNYLIDLNYSTGTYEVIQDGTSLNSSLNFKDTSNYLYGWEIQGDFLLGNCSWDFDHFSVSFEATVPGNITGLSVVAQNNESINIEWTNPADVDYDYAQVWVDSDNVFNESGTAYNATGLTPNTNYTITLYPVDIHGFVGLPTSVDSFTLGTNDTTGPGKATFIGSFHPTNDSLYITWSNPSDVDFSGCEVWAGGISQGSTPSPFFNVTNLLPSTAYNVTIGCFDLLNNYGQNSSIIATTAASPTATTSILCGRPCIMNESFNYAVSVTTRGWYTPNPALAIPNGTHFYCSESDPDTSNFNFIQYLDFDDLTSSDGLINVLWTMDIGDSEYSRVYLYFLDDVELNFGNVLINGELSEAYLNYEDDDIAINTDVQVDYRAEINLEEQTISLYVNGDYVTSDTFYESTSSFSGISIDDAPFSSACNFSMDSIQIFSSGYESPVDPTLNQSAGEFWGGALSLDAKNPGFNSSYCRTNEDINFCFIRIGWNNVTDWFLDAIFSNILVIIGIFIVLILLGSISKR